mmetsp:Transcript_60182/g.118335  ORF Transcript_60182/g.118335 Transcript_60182/m.118335 type:complete len:204 (-) Transcript_60182:515-1126(-)
MPVAEVRESIEVGAAINNVLRLAEVPTRAAKRRSQAHDGLLGGTGADQVDHLLRGRADGRDARDDGHVHLRRPRIEHRRHAMQHSSRARCLQLGCVGITNVSTATLRRSQTLRNRLEVFGQQSLADRRHWRSTCPSREARGGGRRHSQRWDTCREPKGTRDVHVTLHGQVRAGCDDSDGFALHSQAVRRRENEVANKIHDDRG